MSIMNNTIEVMNSYSTVLLEDGSDDTVNISTYIDNIKEHIAANITLNPSLDVSSSHLSNKSTSSPSSLDSSDNIDLGVTEEQRGIVIHLLDRLNDLEMLNFEEKRDYIIKQKILEKQINKLKEENKYLTDDIKLLFHHLYNMDKRIIETEQYPRCQNLIITGIPDVIDQSNLEMKVLEILRSIGMQISSYEIVACHRLKKNKNLNYPAQTIVRFTNRKVVEFCINNRDKLLEVKSTIRMNLRFYENLCESNETVLRWCRELKEYNIIHDYFIRNGYVKIVKYQGNRPIKIQHPDDLYDKFYNYFDHLNLYQT